ncbi:galactose oxidase-like domain-containing protein [Nucisporomicrobium flavum]|uniref:galactose oxidase-like domain-containing protein n=1 Tax=Nucisporomicrobium flavum TaxID=2785915 RepID=UPI0018F7CD9C|nr:galactose oxidase-like domain-containing protein [Nucisporomicrobium flavum]
MRTRRGLIAFGSLFALFLLGAAPAGPATAAAGTEGAEAVQHAREHDPGHEHAEEDLADTPMRVIEEKTAKRAARVQSETGRRPGTARTRAAVVADPGQSGSWSPVVGTPVVPVFQAVLPNGKVLMWDSVGDNAAESYPDHSFTRAMVWNPADDTYKRVDVQGSNIFCAGFAHLGNGNILVAGGNANASLAGTVQTHIFDWRTETWSRGNDMAAARWYPSVAQTANGEEVIVGGGPATAEVYQANGAIRALTSFTQYGGRTYPFMGSRPDAQLGLYGPYTTGYTLTTAGNGVITGTGTRDSIYRDYGSFSTYDIGKTMVVGGGSITEGGTAKVPTRTAVVLSTRTGLVPAVAATGSLATGRRQLNATLLADGSVLATGGMTSAATSGLVDLDHAATAAERWDPATGQWTVLASASRVRQYHSTAVLLPDGRVMTGGGGVCGICMSVGYLEKNLEYFTPPYLYKKDGSGDLAPRPVISTAPAGVGINTAFTVTSPQAATVRKVALVGLGDVTHSVDQGQRYIPLTFTASGTTLTVTGPPNGGVAPPGYYMLFLVDADGVPSTAAMVQVAKGPNPVMSPLKNSTGQCVDIPSSATAIRTYLQAYTCNNTKAQAMTRLPDDTSLRVLGNCVDVPSRQFVAGQKVWTYTCNSTVAQTWRFGTDGTVRPLGNTAMCLAAASTASKAAIQLATCNGAALQKWTW